MHPPGRKVGGSGRGGFANKGHRTAVFNQSDNATSVEEKLKETEAEKHALSERMKRFAQSGETEKIIPGQQQQEQVQGAAADKAPMTTDAAAKTAS